ncbi:hypothetical protein [Bradyrhizobium sp. Rc2d]|uniref:hypothetical protein n=1 Tax=Bradyrhizobium sp. Rc2d TaxID=1855321 RepID=UPI000A8C86C7|nr:hypothetical protein [Bradyrhizobium sp. Rc2d]
MSPFTPSLRIFLSVDIVGSTAFKQSAADGKAGKGASAEDEFPRSEPWFEPIAQFYRGVERTFSKEWSICEEKANSINWPTGPSPELWKSIGDEVIYTKHLTDHREVLSTLYAWVSTVRSYRKILRTQFKTLDLKSTAWIAGFPVHNAEVIFRPSVKNGAGVVEEDDELYSNLQLLHEFYEDREKQMHFTRDFIGPAIDTGFRLAQMSTPRRMVLSLELALMLGHAIGLHLLHKPQTFDYEELSFFFAGRQSFKRVFGGLPYPIFWIDMKPSPSLEGKEDELQNLQPLKTELVYKFCTEFVREHDAYCFTPYIMGNQHPAFADMPERHTRRIEVLRNYWVDESLKRTDEKAAGLAKNEQGAATEQKTAERVLKEILK